MGYRIVQLIVVVLSWLGMAQETSYLPGNNDARIQETIEREQTLQELGVIAKDSAKDIVIGVIGTDTFLNVSNALRAMLTKSGGVGALVRASDRFSLYLRGYVGSCVGVKLAEVEEARLSDLRREIEAGQLGARDKEQQAHWMGVDAFVAGRYGYGRIKGLGFVPLKHARLSVTVSKGPNSFELLTLAPYSTTGSSDPAMALNAAQDLRDLTRATPEQRRLAEQIAIASQRYHYLRHAGFLLPLLAGVEYIAAGIIASRWEQKAAVVGDNPNGYMIAKYACYVLGGVTVIASPVNPIMTAIYKHKQKRLKREYNRIYGERYVLK